jgi:hypothetical protein
MAGRWNRPFDVSERRWILVAALVHGDFSGGAEIEPIVGQNQEILHEGLGKGDQAEFGRADYP